MYEIMGYLGPPLGGAVIGYVTNAIAIRMLFRPLKAWRIFGIRVPLTPGIIPARRAELARNIGKMVGQHLLTRGEILDALERPAFRESLEKAMGSFMERLWGFDLENLGGGARGAWRQGWEEIVAAGVGAVENALRDPVFKDRLRGVIADFADSGLGRPLGDLSAGFRDDPAAGLARGVARAVGSPVMRERISVAAEEFVFRHLGSVGRLRDLVSDDVYLLITETVRGEVPGLLARLSSLLEDDRVRERLTRALSSAVHDSIRNAGLLARMFRVLLGEANLEERLRETVDRVRVEAVAWLGEEGTAERVADILSARIDRLADGDLQVVLSRIPEERVAAARRFGREQLSSILRSPRLEEEIESWVRQGLAGRSDRSLRDLIRELWGDGAAENSRDVLVETILRLVVSQAEGPTVPGGMKALLDHLLARFMTGTLRDHLSPRVRREMELLVLDQFRDLLAREVPELVDSLDVEGIVEARVNRLDILRVEDMIESIMREQFTYINVFGAFLGFLIGWANLLWIP